jgi:hypothetical protein
MTTLRNIGWYFVLAGICITYLGWSLQHSVRQYFGATL